MIYVRQAQGTKGSRGQAKGARLKGPGSSGAPRERGASAPPAANFPRSEELGKVRQNPIEQALFGE